MPRTQVARRIRFNKRRALFRFFRLISRTLQPRQPPTLQQPLISITQFVGKSAYPSKKITYFYHYQWIYWLYTYNPLLPDPTTLLIDGQLCTPLSVHARILMHTSDLVRNCEGFAHIADADYTNYQTFRIMKVVFDIEIDNRAYDQQGTICIGFEPNQHPDHQMELVNIRPAWNVKWLPMLDSHYIVNRYRWHSTGSVTKSHRITYVPEQESFNSLPHHGTHQFGIITMHYMSYGQHTRFDSSAFNVNIKATTYFEPSGYTTRAQKLQNAVVDCYANTVGEYGFNTIGAITTMNDGDWFLGQFLNDGKITVAGKGQVQASGFVFKYFDGEIDPPKVDRGLTSGEFQKKGLDAVNTGMDPAY